MVDISAIGSALSSFKAAKDIAEAMIGLRDASAFQSKLIEFQSKILDAHDSAFAAQEERSALIDKVRQLEEEVANFKAWETEKKRYELKPLAEGVFAYALKPDAQGSEPAHWICAGCYQNAQKSILQTERREPGMIVFYVCHSCGAELISGGFRSPQHARAVPRGRRR
jgi:hypothetical protein